MQGRWFVYIDVFEKDQDVYEELGVCATLEQVVTFIMYWHHVFVQFLSGKNHLCIIDSV